MKTILKPCLYLVLILITPLVLLIVFGVYGEATPADIGAPVDVAGSQVYCEQKFFNPAEVIQCFYRNGSKSDPSAAIKTLMIGFSDIASQHSAYENRITIGGILTVLFAIFVFYMVFKAITQRQTN